MQSEITVIIALLIVLTLIVVVFLAWKPAIKTSRLAQALGIQQAAAVYDKEQSPSQAEWGKRRADLAKKKVAQSDVDWILGTHNNMLTRTESAKRLEEYCRDLKKEML